MTDIQSVNIEFYTPYEVQLGDICIITLFKKNLTESFYEHRDVIENFKKDEDLFISWLASIASSKNYPLARVILVDSGFSIEAIYSSIKPRYFVEHPCLSRVKRIYAIDKLRVSNEVSKFQVSVPTEESTEESNNDQKLKETSVNANLLLDFSNDELYIFFSQITVINSTKAEALIIETDRGIEFLRLDSLPSTELTKVSTKESKRKKKKKKKRRSRRSSRVSKALS